MSMRSGTAPAVSPDAAGAPVARSEQRPSEVSRAIAVLVAGLALRLAIALVSRGTNDIESWERYGEQSAEHGVIWMYRNVLLWNHPPLMGYLVASLKTLSILIGAPFAPVFKLVPILADVVIGCLLYVVFRRRDASLALRAAAFFAFSLDAVLVSAYHGNTDPLLAASLLGSAVAVERGRYGLAGAVLALGCNVKLIPLLAAPLLVARARPRELVRFVAGGLPGIIPFLPVWLLAGREFYRNAIAYRSNFDNWGLALPIRTLNVMARRLGLDGLRDITYRIRDVYMTVGPYFMLAAIVALAAYARRTKSLTVYELVALGLAIFLVFTPGFGVQYTAILGPVLIAAAPRWGLLWGAVSGLFLLSIYASFYNGGFPLHSHFTSAFPPGPTAVGIGAWAVLVALLVSYWRAERRAKSSEAAAEVTPL